jgi:hypothetical protein
MQNLLIENPALECLTELPGSHRFIGWAGNLRQGLRRACN